MTSTAATAIDPLAPFRHAYEQFNAEFDRMDDRGGPMHDSDLAAGYGRLLQAFPKDHPEARALNTAVTEAIEQHKPHLVFQACQRILARGA